MSKTIAVGQGGGPTSVTNDTLAGVVYEAQLRGYDVIGLRNGLEGGGLNPNIDGNLVDLTSIEPFHLRGIPGAYLGTTRVKLRSGKDDDKISRIRSNVKGLGADATIYIGGNDSAEVIRALGNGVHAAKTEDNDLPAQDHTPGWGSACLSNCEIIRAMTCDIGGFSPRVSSPNGAPVYSVAPVVVYQTQGRDTGWITLGTAFAKVNHAGDVIPGAAPHLFWPRERPFKTEELIGSVDDLLRKQGYVFIVCGEELVDESGTPLSKLYGQGGERRDPHDHVEHSRSGSFNYADFLASMIKKNLRVDSAAYQTVKETPITPHHIQRSLRRSLVDAQEAFEVGREVVRAIARGELNVSIGLLRGIEGYTIRAAPILLDLVAGQVRMVDEKYLGNIHGPTEAFYRDFLPLVGGPLGMTQYVGPRLQPPAPRM